MFTLLKNYVYDTTSVRKRTGADGQVLLGKCRCLLPPPPDTPDILQGPGELIGNEEKESEIMLEQEKSQPKELKQGVVWVRTGCCWENAGQGEVGKRLESPHGEKVGRE